MGSGDGELGEGEGRWKVGRGEMVGGWGDGEESEVRWKRSVMLGGGL